MFEGFVRRTLDVGEATLRVRISGHGPGLLLLHGHPQTHVMWHQVAPRLAERFTVVAPDLRGYGENSNPASTSDHEPYSKRAMARDGIRLMAHLGFDRFAVVGHDRGARVAYRLALDHPAPVERLAVLDIIPTGEVFRRISFDVAMAYAGWFFLAQPAPRPETIIGQNPDAYSFAGKQHLFAPEALADDRRAVAQLETIHAVCEDYPAGASFDRSLDDADRGQRRITCPLLALWAAHDDMGKLFDVLGICRDWADDVQGTAIDAEHYLPEEAPDEVLAELLPFLLARSSAS